MNFVARKEDTLQFFKEERLEGVVYNVYLKKVRYHTPDVGIQVPPAPAPDGSNSLFYLNIAAQDGTDRGRFKQWSLEEVRVLKSGTLDRLVENLSSHTGEIDSTYVNIFLATYRSFASPKQVLNILFERYKSIANDRKLKQDQKQYHLKTIKTVISVWLDSYRDDFDEPPNFPCLSSMKTFACKHMKSVDLEDRAQRCIERFNGQELLSRPIIVEDAVGPLAEQLTLVDIEDCESPGYFFKFTDFESIPETTFAEQLTYIDSELFKKVVPHQCLGSVWSCRSKKDNKAPSVMATVEQFNNVSYRVVATVLKRPDLPAEERALVIEKWIDIAQELRKVKNFSSLKAIVSGLQSNAIYRLKKVWASISKERMELFEEHSEIFSEENNQIMSRELLVMEGTAKFANPDSTATIRGHKRKGSGWTGTVGRRKSTYFEVTQTVQGTIPYLGTFLTDLVMLDTATRDYTEDGLVNFDKKRKEFELLAQIRLLQSSAQMYRIRPDRGFFEWFYNIRVYDEKESYELSCDIEPYVPTTPTTTKGHRKRPSLGFFSPKNLLGITSTNDDSTTDVTDTSNDDTKSLYSNPEFESTPVSGNRPSLRHSVSVSALSTLSDDITPTPWKSPESLVIKVFLEVSECHYSNYYKSILLSNSDHTKTVISNILLKFNIDNALPAHFVLFQVHQDGELQIPDKGNVFYAIKQDVQELKFVMRRKSELEKLKTRHLKGKGKRKKFTL